MIKYNTLKIEGDYLIVNCEVEDKTYYSDVTIRGIRVDTPLTYGTDDPYYLVTQDNSTNYIEKIPIPDAKKDLLIITPQVNAVIPPDAPCGADVVDIAVIYDKDILLDKGLIYLNELGDTCEISRSFIDFILKSYALDMAIATCNYSTAIKYWKMLTGIRTVSSKGCGCNGK